MSMELPLIATFWSGPTEFMTEENSFPLKTKGLVSVGSGMCFKNLAAVSHSFQGPFASHRWAEPDSEHLIELMQTIVKNPDAAVLVCAF